MIRKEAAMVRLMVLWMPILLSAVFVFLASWIIHMFLPYHRSDYKKMPSEDDVMDAIRRFNVPPGDYMVPRAGSPSAMRDPAFLEKLKKGPVFLATIFPSGGFGMGKQLLQWFVYCLVVSVFAAYVAGRALPAGAPYLHVFRFAGVTAFTCYGIALWQDSIWYRRSWATTFKSNVDSLIYGMLTAGTFGWLWPK
jgi:hypothetical protein